MLQGRISRRVFGGLAGAVIFSSAGAQELTPFQEERAEQRGKVRQLQPYLDRWKTPDTDALFRDPNEQSRYQGDVPFYDDWLFLNLELVVDALYKHRENPEFTGIENTSNDFRRLIGLFGFEVRNADDVFKPATFRLRMLGAAEIDEDFNALNDGSNDHLTLQEGFADVKLFDLGALDLAFLRAGLEPFKSEFHGLIFFDTALSARIFGEYAENKYRYTLGVFRLVEKDPTSNLTDFEEGLFDRHVGVASLAVNDVLPGWLGEFSVHYFRDREGDADVDAWYAGSTFNGRVGSIQFNPAAYLTFGTDDTAGVDQDIFAYTFLLDAAYTLPAADYVTLRAGYLHQSGDDDPNDGDQSAFRPINDNVALFGAGASYWTGEAILTADGLLVGPNSAFTALGGRQGPGAHVFNVGSFVKLTQRLDFFLNGNWIRFAETDGLAGDVDSNVGFDLNGLLEWRPLQQNTFVIDQAASVLFPQDGWEDVFGEDDAVWAVTTNVRFIY